MALGTEVGDAYISIHADTTPFRGDLAKLNRIIGNATQKNNDYADSLDRVTDATKRNSKANRTHSDTVRKLGNDTHTASRKVDRSRGVFEKFADNVSSRWRRMDSTVRIVLALILAAGPQMATLGSVLSSSLTAVAAAAAGAVLALAPLAGLIAPLIVSFAGIASVLEGLKEQWNEFTDAVQSNALAGIGDTLSDALGPLFDTLLEILNPQVFAAIGDALGGIIGTLTDTLSKMVVPLTDALEGPLTTAFETFISTLTGPLLEAFLTFITATAPIAELLANMFERWGTGIAEFFAQAAESGALYDFFRDLLLTLESVLDFLGAVKDVLITVFQAAVEPGRQFLDILTRLLSYWNDWMTSVEGQEALQEWFDNLFAVLPSIMDLLAAAGKAIADLVTPAAVEATTHLLTALADIMPILSDVIALLAEAGVVDVLAQALLSLGEIITPLIEPFGDLLSAISGELITVLKTLAPQFTGIGTGLGVLATALIPLVPILGDFITQLVQGLGPSVEELMPMVADLIGLLIPVISEVMSAFAPLIPVISQLAITLLESLWPAFEALAPALIRLVDALAPVISALVTSLAPILVPIIDSLVQLATVVLDALLPVFEALMPSILILVDTALVPLLTLINTLLPIIILLVEMALMPLQVIFEVLTPIIELFAEVMQMTMNNAIIPITTAIGNWIDKNNVVRENLQKVMDRVSNFAKAVTTAKDNVVTAVENMWESFQNLKSDIDNLFENIGNGIESAFKGAFNAVARAWNSTVGKLEIKVPSWVPNWGGNTWGVPDMPYAYASGGVASTPTFGVFGEAGREALVPLDRPLDQVDPSVRWLSAIAQGKAGSTSNNSATVTINTPATDPRLIASILEDSIFNDWR